MFKGGSIFGAKVDFRRIGCGGGCAKKGPVLPFESRPWENFVGLNQASHQKKRIVLVAILACSSSEQPAFVAAPAETSVGFTRSLLRR